MSYLLLRGNARRLPIDPREIDAIVTDPPFGIYSKGGKWGHKNELKWDRNPAQAIVELVAMVSLAVVWGGNYFDLPESRGWFVWYKRDAVPSASDCELAWTSMDRNTELFDWPIAATNGERCGHPTQKPVALMRWCIQKLKLKPNSLIVDPYCGSGSTGIAALQEGHRFIGLDLDADYVRIAKRRIERPHARVPRPAKQEYHPLFGEME